MVLSDLIQDLTEALLVDFRIIDLQLFRRILHEEVVHVYAGGLICRGCDVGRTKFIGSLLRWLLHMHVGRSIILRLFLGPLYMLLDLGSLLLLRVMLMRWRSTSSLINLGLSTMHDSWWKSLSLGRLLLTVW